MPAVSPTMRFATRITGATQHRLVRKARTAVRLLRDDPAKLSATVRKRLHRGPRRRSLLPPQTTDLAPVTLGHVLAQPAERGYLVLERRRRYAEKDLLIALTIHDPDGQVLKPGRDWKRSRSLDDFYLYLPPSDEDTVVVPFTASGDGAARVRITLRRWSASAPAPAEAFGAAWMVWEQVRRTGAAPHRLGIADLGEVA